MLLEFLQMRFSVPDDIRKRVDRCDDEEQIKTWFKLVPTATSVGEIFSELRPETSKRNSEDRSSIGSAYPRNRNNLCYKPSW